MIWKLGISLVLLWLSWGYIEIVDKKIETTIYTQLCVFHSRLNGDLASDVN